MFDDCICMHKIYESYWPAICVNSSAQLAKKLIMKPEQGGRNLWKAILDWRNTKYSTNEVGSRQQLQVWFYAAKEISADMEYLMFLLLTLLDNLITKSLSNFQKSGSLNGVHQIHIIASQTENLIRSENS